MKRALCIALLTVALAVAVHAEEPLLSGMCSPVQPGGVVQEMVLPPTSVVAALQSCGAFDGTACTTPGERVRCAWIPGEPGRCVCSSSFIWNCG